METYSNIKNHLATYSEKSDQTVYVKGNGVTFTDEYGKEYLNLNDISCVLGYNHPLFNQKLGEIIQNKMLAHTGVLSKDKELLIHNFMEVTHHDFDKIFFAGSGGEVVDYSLKIARRASGKDGIVSFTNALHGRSFAGAFISGTPLRKEGFGTGLENVYFWPYPGDGREFEPTANNYNNIGAIIIEPYQAISAMESPNIEYWKWLRKYTKENGIILIIDEIQTGFGKTGSFFAYEKIGIVPDILLSGKGMSNGFGLGALLMRKDVAKHIKPLELSGGSADNDFMCSVVNGIFDIYKEEKIIEHVKETGEIFRGELHKLLDTYKVEHKFYGTGLFFSVQLPGNKAEMIQKKAKDYGIMFGRSGCKLVVRSPLVLTKEEVKKVCEIIEIIMKSI